jgi:ubiquinone/menaquinone biosynthesis C-methylase UbiE
MKLNPFELALVNNPLRAWSLRSTVGWLHDAACAPPADRVLEVGCGQGDGGLEIASRFHPRAFHAFDLDEAQVARARERLGALAADRIDVRLWTGDVERIDAPDAHYDVVFEFMILHHVPEWRRALAEIARVLRPGGAFCFEELSTEFFSDVPLVSPLLRWFTQHPWSTMFDFPAFREALGTAGFRVTALHSNWLPGWHHGVAVRA